ncbi:large repetitive protein [Amycolatopsis sp. NPDC051061]|uniref:large repetitive protein n=1 Tax=Amycolatopsis sp. NPDC051061 TaxID=3155042 RepID=UPI00342A144A
MSDSEGTPTLVGQYSAPAPPLDPSFFSTIEALSAVVGDLVYNSDGSKAGAGKDTTAEAWYSLESGIKAAEAALADVNDKFAKEIKAMKDNLEGDAGDAFAQYATAILNTSEEVYSTLMQKQFGANSGNVGHAAQTFAAGWWQINDEADAKLVSLTAAIKGNAALQIQAAQDVAQVAQITQQQSQDLSTTKTNISSDRLASLQAALGTLGTNYLDRAADYVPLYISDGNTATAAPTDSFQRQVNQPPQQQQQQENKPQQPIYTADRKLGIQNTEPNVQLAPGENTPGQPTEPPAALTGAAGPADAGLPPATPGVSPEQQQALNDAKNAAGQAIDGLTGQTDDPARQQALNDAKNAAQGAIGGVANPAAGGLAGTPGSPGAAPGGVDPATQQALNDAKNAAGQAIDGLTGQTNDPKRKQALADAKKASQKAIDDLTNPAALPGDQLAGGPGGPGDGALDEAKKAAGQAIDDLAKPGDSEARQQALEDAKKAAMNAVGGVGDKPGAVGGPGAADQQERGQLQDAKHAAQKAIDDLIGKTDDPDRKHALEDAKQAMTDAVDKTAAPEHFKQVEDAKHAADKAIDGLREQGADPQRQHALDAAKSAAEKAIAGISDAPELSGPGHEQALEHAKEEADKAIDALCKPDDTPAEQQALVGAKDAVNKAIDGIGEDSGNAMHQFLTSSGSPGEFGPPRGGLAGVGGGHGPVMPETAGGPGGGPGANGHLPGGGPGAEHLAGGGPGPGGNPSTAGGPPPGKFDTQPFQGGQPAAAAAAGAPVPASGQAPASAGAPMGPMGGMGGGGGNQGEKEREPQIWMQAEAGAWGNKDGEEPPSHVLGRN